MTTRARVNAVLYHLAPPRTGKRRRPRRKGDRIGTAAQIAKSGTWTTVSVSRYGATTTVEITEQVCLWYGVWRIGQPARRALDGRRKRCVNKRAGRWTAAPTHGYNLGGLDNLAEETLERIRHE